MRGRFHFKQLFWNLIKSLYMNDLGLLADKLVYDEDVSTKIQQRLRLSCLQGAGFTKKLSKKKKKKKSMESLSTKQQNKKDQLLLGVTNKANTA